MLNKNYKVHCMPPPIASHLQFAFAAERAGQCDLGCADQGGRQFSFKERQPKLFVIGDYTSVSMGPAGFQQPSVLKAINCASTFCVVSCAAIPEPYALMTLTAIASRTSVMIVETRLKHEAEWYNFIERLGPTKNILLATVGGGHA